MRGYHRLPGGGPWRILQICPCDRHNNLRAAINGRPKRCVCPRALDLNPEARSNFDGGGPWKILDSCPASKHNTESAAMGRCGNRRQCICPRAIYLKPFGLAKMRRYWDGRRREDGKAKAEPRVPRPPMGPRFGLPVWWSGPWKILEGCPAEGHNTVQRAARPRKGHVPCICPRGVALRDEHLERRRVRERAAEERRAAGEKAAPKRKPKPRVPALRAFKPKELPDVMVRPNFNEGRCTKPWNVTTFSAAMDAGGSTTSRARQVREMARAACRQCPIREQCRAYVIGQEKPAGSWGGMWGGLDVFQRVELAKRRKQEEKQDAA